MKLNIDLSKTKHSILYDEYCKEMRIKREDLWKNIIFMIFFIINFSVFLFISKTSQDNTVKISFILGIINFFIFCMFFDKTFNLYWDMCKTKKKFYEKIDILMKKEIIIA